MERQTTLLLLQGTRTASWRRLKILRFVRLRRQVCIDSHIRPSNLSTPCLSCLLHTTYVGIGIYYLDIEIRFPTRKDTSTGARGHGHEHKHIWLNDRLTSVFAVARIAYQASDVVVSVQPSQGQDSTFSSHLKALAARKEPGLVAKAAGALPEVWQDPPTLPPVS